jgi:hypothetical protein
VNIHGNKLKETIFCNFITNRFSRYKTLKQENDVREIKEDSAIDGGLVMVPFYENGNYLKIEPQFVMHVSDLDDASFKELYEIPSLHAILTFLPEVFPFVEHLFSFPEVTIEDFKTLEEFAFSNDSFSLKNRERKITPVQEDKLREGNFKIGFIKETRLGTCNTFIIANGTQYLDFSSRKVIYDKTGLPRFCCNSDFIAKFMWRNYY